jgi:glutathione S-transferase
MPIQPRLGRAGSDRQEMGAPLPCLITMPHSHYCEKARWALDLAKVSYLEEPHLPVFHRIYTARHKGTSVPLLVTPSGTCTGSAEIVRYAHRNCASAGLIPEDPERRGAALSLESYFDRELGPATRTWAYFQLQHAQPVLNRIVSRGVPLLEQRLTPLVMTIATRLIGRAYNVNAESAYAALRRVWEIFEEVARSLFRRNTLVQGGEITVADITFAALASPVLLPANFGGACPSIDELPEPMRTEVECFRDSRAGAHALRLYETRRRVDVVANTDKVA